MANLARFKEIIGGGVRPNQFVVEVDTPLGNLGELKFLCHAASLPGSSISQAPVFHRGRMISLAGERSFNPWTISVYADQNLEIRTQLERWSNVINNYGDNTGTTDPRVYKAHALYVTQLGRNNEAIKSYRMRDAWPIDLSEMQLSWQANDQVSEFSVTFAMDWFEPIAPREIDPAFGVGSPTVVGGDTNL
jgi:hypothetical protein